MNTFDYIQDLNAPESIQAVWEKGIVVDGYDPDLYRQDFGGAWIARDAYGDREREFGWEIDHVFPIDKGGDNNLLNLRPMNWKNNVSKGNDYPVYWTNVIAQDNKNIEKRVRCTVNASLQQKLEELYKQDRPYD